MIHLVTHIEKKTGASKNGIKSCIISDLNPLIVTQHRMIWTHHGQQSLVGKEGRGRLLQLMNVLIISNTIPHFYHQQSMIWTHHGQQSLVGLG